MLTTKELASKLFDECPYILNGDYPFEIDFMGKSIAVTTYSLSKTTFQELKIPKAYLDTKGFSMQFSGMSVIFLQDNLNHSDGIRVLLHELGHILKEHTVDAKGILGNNPRTIIQEKEENEANEFVECFLKLEHQKTNATSKQKRKSMSLLVAVCAVISLSSTLLALQNNISSETSQVIYDTQKPKLESIIHIEDEAMEHTVFAIPGAEKFHLHDCRYVKDKHDLLELSIEEAIREGYSACQVCRPLE